MGLLSDIQTSLLEGHSLASALLKMRVLAARLESGELADWVRYETEGYPEDAEIPDYRKVSAQYYGHFVGSFGRQITDAPIPNAFIAKYISKDALQHNLHQSISGIERLIEMDETGVLTASISDYALRLQGHIYPDFNCITVNSKISVSTVSGIITTVRSKLLDLTLEIEKRMPEARNVEFNSNQIADKQQEVSQMVQQIVYGGINTVNNNGDHSTFNTNITQGDAGDVVEHLTKNGISETDAKCFADILTSEKPSSEKDPLGPNAKSWIAANIIKAMNGAWKIGLPVATALLTDVAERYYGLK